MTKEQPLNLSSTMNGQLLTNILRECNQKEIILPISHFPWLKCPLKINLSPQLPRHLHRIILSNKEENRNKSYLILEHQTTIETDRLLIELKTKMETLLSIIINRDIKLYLDKQCIQTKDNSRRVIKCLRPNQYNL